MNIEENWLLISNRRTSISAKMKNNSFVRKILYNFDKNHFSSVSIYKKEEA